MRCRPCTTSTLQDLPTVNISECPHLLRIRKVLKLRQQESSPLPRQRIVHRVIQCLAGTWLTSMPRSLNAV